MGSTLGCIGLAVEDDQSLDALVERLVPEADVVATSGDLQARRWIDGTGASLTMTVRSTGDDSGVLVDVVPSYVAPDGAAEPDGPDGLAVVRVGALTGYGETLAADLVDESGASIIRIACDLAQSIVAEIADPRPARLTALGLDITVHADAAAFAAADESILGTPQAHEAPQRLATESLVAYGLAATPEQARPLAFLAGTVLAVTSHVNTETEQAFHALGLQSLAGPLTVCVAAGDHPEAPQVGNVLSGVCYLVLDVPDLW